MNKTRCIFYRERIKNPIEKGMTLFEQMTTDFTKLDGVIYTNSPAIVSQFSKCQVLICQNIGCEMENPIGETYGASLDILYKQLFQAKNLMPNVVIDDIKTHLPDDNDNDVEIKKSKEWMENNLGESMEKVYLLRKLS